MSGTNHPMYGRTHSDEARQKMSIARSGISPSDETRKKMSEAKGTPIFVLSLKDQSSLTFPSSRAAAKHFTCGKNTIMKYARSNAIFREEYILSLVEIPSTE